MITRNPLDRHDLNIKKSDNVLEIGSGHNPTFRSNTIVEKYIDTNYHRCGDIKIYSHQKFVNASGESLPFKDKEFDYVICNQVLEHVEDPVRFIREQCRVAKRGYLETPSLLGEFLFPKRSHRWVILYIDNKLVLFEKDKIPGNYGNNYGELFLNYLPYQSLFYKLLWFTEGNLMLNRCEWIDDIDIIVNPTDEKYLSFFTTPWNREMVQQLYPPRSLAKEIVKSIKALKYLLKSKMRKNKHQALDLDEYMKLHSK